MDKQILINALRFLERSDLKGHEYKAFSEVIDLLNKLLKEEENKLTEEK